MSLGWFWSAGSIHDNLALSSFEDEVLLALFALVYNILALFETFELHRVNYSLKRFLAKILGQEGLVKAAKQFHTIFLTFWEFWRGESVDIAHIVSVENDL